MECLYKEDVDRIFTLDEPFKEMGSEAIEVPALKDEEFAQITVLGLRVSFPNGINLFVVLWDYASFFCAEARELTIE
ncbi:hypothetical protein Tco_1462422, partial [Tanacetum coccineum]